MTENSVLHARAMIDIAQLLPGMRVADFGAGRTAHFVLPLARAVGEEGVVYAVDIHPEALSMLRGHRSLHEIPHLNVVRGDIERFGGIDAIPPRSLDRIFLVNTLWMTRRFASIVAEARRLLAHDGVIIVADWDPRARHVVAPEQSLRVVPEAIDRIFADGGCERCGVFQPGRHHWGRIYSA